MTRARSKKQSAADCPKWRLFKQTMQEVEG